MLSQGALPDDLKKLFSKLMNHVYSFKQKSQELIVKVLKEFADYESSSNRNSPSPDLRSMSENMNVVPEMIDPEVIVEKVERGASLAKDPSKAAVDVGSGPCSKRDNLNFHLDGSQIDISQPYDCSFKIAHRDAVVGKSSSLAVPLPDLGDVIPVVKDDDIDPKVDPIKMSSHYVTTLPFSDDDSPHITPNLSKKLPPTYQLNSSSKAGCSASVPLNISSPEVTVVGSLSLSQKLKSMGKKSDALYNSKLHSPKSAFKSLSKTRGYPCPSPNSFGGSSSKSDFKLSDSSTGGKVPIHGPRRAVFPSRIMSDEFDIVRVTFKVNKSQIMNYKAICNLAMSRDSGKDAIMSGGVRCTFWSLGESLKPGGVVNNFVMAAWCYHLYSQPCGHPDVSKCHFFFSNIGDQLLKDVDSANEDILRRAFTRSSKTRPLHRSDLLFFPCFYEEHWFVFVVDIKDQCFVFLDSYYVLQPEFQVEVRDRLIPNFKFWWEKLVMLDMGFEMYKLLYPFVPRQPAQNISDSGVYVMMFLEYWKSPRSSLFTLFKESDIPNLRIKIANELLFSPKNSGRKDLVIGYKFVGEEAV
ncbi:uncharacterized protein LOC8075699 isoform X2 [Sorghum bicolor]|uniref:uncharacterized protein LOC8075699 isoform X2 n=1 Tax=Sorghum bicolor TaxID=4558 RepID=UPI000B423B86|nr:uncharacterized protein LOC8075699 isoform X2 [Sorghum bicolor]|eukprot:XP_021314320.1 uncharacterized protein LOC8075699 isoform X2 [Sorghum bicolor]